MAVEQTAFEALKSIANLSLQKAQTLPEQHEAANQWSGVGFSLMGVDMVVPLGAVSEMLEMGLYAGLWVDKVHGIKSFDLDDSIESMPGSIAQRIQHFLVGGFSDEEKKDWYIFDLTNLAGDEQFQNVAAD